MKKNILDFLNSKVIHTKEGDFISLDDAFKATAIARQDILDKACTYSNIESWYQSSINETEEPIWTDAHINELMNDFILIPKSSIQK